MKTGARIRPFETRSAFLIFTVYRKFFSYIVYYISFDYITFTIYIIGLCKLFLAYITSEPLISPEKTLRTFRRMVQIADCWTLICTISALLFWKNWFIIKLVKTEQPGTSKNPFLRGIRFSRYNCMPFLPSSGPWNLFILKRIHLHIDSVYTDFTVFDFWYYCFHGISLPHGFKILYIICDPIPIINFNYKTYWMVQNMFFQSYCMVSMSASQLAFPPGRDFEPLLRIKWKPRCFTCS